MNKVTSLYLHFPFCRHLCNYCDFYKHKLENATQINQFEKVLLDQINYHQNFLIENNFNIPMLETLYIGGGTPSLWSTMGSQFLKNNLLNRYELSPNCEFTLEIDPGTWTEDEIEKWLAIGVNRFSIGVQSYNANYLKIMDRAHNIDQVDELLSYLQKNHLNYSVDLMIGLPEIEGHKRDIQNEIEKLCAFDPKHFSVYILKTRKNYPHNKKLPSDDVVADEYLNTCENLQKFGYSQYEVSNFAKPSFFSLHNKKYWQYESVACIGPNATGLLVQNDKATRYRWKTGQAQLELEPLQETSLKIEKLYMQMRAKHCLKLDYLSIADQIAFNELRSSWFARNLCTAKGGEFELTSQGYLLLDSLMDEIFNRLRL